jgi:hypothetical protein
VGNKLRPRLGDVKRATPTSCGVLHKQHNILRNYSLLQQLSDSLAAEAGSGFSAPVPPVLHDFSTAFPQDFAQGCTASFLGKSASFPQD